MSEQTFHTGPVPGSDGGQTAMSAVDQNQVGAVAAVAREEAELKAAIVVARRFPRNEADAYARIMKTCENGTFAADAEYVFPRGGQDVDGLSIDFAREAARIWGNIRYGLRIVSSDDHDVHIKGWAHDAETNAFVEAEDKFAKLVFRKKSGWIKPDERDLRELVNRRGAICVRNAILQLLPSYLKGEAHSAVKRTKIAAAAGTLKQDRAEAVRKMVRAFADLNVTVEMLEGYLGHKVDAVTDQEFANLTGIGKSMRDGNTRRDDHFEAARPESMGTVDLDGLKQSDAAPREHPSTERARAAASNDEPAPEPEKKEQGKKATGKSGAMFG